MRLHFASALMYLQSSQCTMIMMLSGNLQEQLRYELLLSQGEHALLTL